MSARWRAIASSVVVGFSLVLAALVDQLVEPRNQFVATPFAVPILLAAVWFSRRGTIITIVLSVAVAAYAARVDDAPLVPALFHLCSLVIIGTLVLVVAGQRRAAAERARAAEQTSSTLRTLIDTLPAGVVVADARGAITLDNPAARVILGGAVTGTAFGPRGGYTLLALDGSPFPSQDLPLSRAIERGEATLDIEMEVQHSDGVKRSILAAGNAVRDAEGRIVGAVTIFQDITGRRRAAAERERLLAQIGTERARLQAILDNAPLGIVFVQALTGRVTANTASRQLFGRLILSDVGRNPITEQLRHPDGSPVTLAELPSTLALQGRPTATEEFLIVQPSGRRVPTRGRAVPIRGPTGQILGAVAVFEDISAQKQLEQLREEWTTLIAHDLRQPVTIIAGYAGLLARNATQVPPSLRAPVDHIIASVRQLDRMIADLVDVSRIEARRLTLKPQGVDLPALVQAVVERMADITRGHPVRVETNGDIPLLKADPVRIEQVLANLVSNAAKYSDPGTDIGVVIERRDGDAEVSVTNHGYGIAPDELSKLFTRFYRTRETHAGRVAGLGLGLYISKGIVEMHDGRIWVESIPGQTTTVHFTLPIPPPTP